MESVPIGGSASSLGEMLVTVGSLNAMELVAPDRTAFLSSAGGGRVVPDGVCREPITP
jgi:hypothetical protein